MSRISKVGDGNGLLGAASEAATLNKTLKNKRKKGAALTPEMIRGVAEFIKANPQETYRCRMTIDEYDALPPKLQRLFRVVPMNPKEL